METIQYTIQQSQKEDILHELMLINNCISDSKSVISRIKSNERLCLIPINKKKRKIIKK